MPNLIVFIFLFIITVGCSSSHNSNFIYKAKGGKDNTPYDDKQFNNKELKTHQKQARKRQKEINQVDHTERDPSHGAKDVGVEKEKKKK